MTFDELLTELGIDSAYTLVRFSGMKNILERFLLRFLDDSCMELLNQAFAHGNPDDAERAAHTLKGLAANLGLDELSRRAAQCVQTIRNNDFETAKQQYPYISEEYERIIHILKKYTDSL